MLLPIVTRIPTKVSFFLLWRSSKQYYLFIYFAYFRVTMRLGSYVKIRGCPNNNYPYARWLSSASSEAARGLEDCVASRLAGQSCSSSRLLFSLVAMTCSLFCYQGWVHCFSCFIYCFLLRSHTVSGKLQGLSTHRAQLESIHTGGYLATLYPLTHYVLHLIC